MINIFNLKRLAVATTLAVSMASASLAANVVANDPDTVLNYFKDAGFPSKLTTDSVDDPLVEVKYFGTNFDIYFYGCSNNTNCTSLQFYSGYQTNGRISIEQANEWNNNNRFMRAYVTDSGSIRIEGDAYTGKTGLTEDDFGRLVDIWLKALTDFEKEIDW